MRAVKNCKILHHFLCFIHHLGTVLYVPALGGFGLGVTKKAGDQIQRHPVLTPFGGAGVTDVMSGIFLDAETFSDFVEKPAGFGVAEWGLPIWNTVTVKLAGKAFGFLTTFYLDFVIAYFGSLFYLTLRMKSRAFTGSGSTVMIMDDSHICGA